MAEDSVRNDEDLIDSRDVIARLEVLARLHEAGPVDLGSAEDNEADQDELFAEERVLSALAAEASQYAPDWEYGETLIRDSYFVEYAQELAEDIGAIKDTAEWPYTCIDWERAARDLQMDYTSVDFDGVTYWIR